MRRRWGKHKNEFKKGLNTSRLASHSQEMTHPDDPELEFLTVLLIDTVRSKAKLLGKEVWWQENVDVHKFGLNKINDLAAVSRRRRIEMPGLSQISQDQVIGPSEVRAGINVSGHYF